MLKKVNIRALKSNPDNPRIIKDDKFFKLVKSIKDFPEMLEARPIVVNRDMVVIGGNMRLRAIKEAGIDEVMVDVREWTKEKEREFIIKDNVGFGEWDWEMLANGWDGVQLEGWGITNFSVGISDDLMDESNLDVTEQFDPIGNSSGLQRVVFIFNDEKSAEDYLNNSGIKFKKTAMAWQVNLCTQ